MIINKCIVVSDYATDWLEKVINQANLDGYSLVSVVMANNRYNCECMYLFFEKEIQEAEE